MNFEQSQLTRPVTWIHIGDTHLTTAGEQNDRDLGQIVDEINELHALGGIDFVFLPGDIADDGSATAYRVARSHLDRLKLPWVGIVGDHDVHEHSFANFQNFIASDLYSAFTIGSYRFFRLNAFSEPKPDSFNVDGEQLDWLEQELRTCVARNMGAVLLLHCYPSDLKQGYSRLRDLLQTYPVLLVDMGHTHYNELSNDASVLYSATRSTGQVEEGSVGYSVLSLDQNVVSWHFVRLGSASLANITHPADYRLLTTRTSSTSPTEIRAKIWSKQPIRTAFAEIEGERIQMSPVDGVLWAGLLPASHLRGGTHQLTITAQDNSGHQISSGIRLVTGEPPSRQFSPVDQENAIGAWPERDILGTQLGPNKNGRKW